MFWYYKNEYLDNDSVIDEFGRRISYRELFYIVDIAAKHLCSFGDRCLGFLFISNTLDCLVAYLACLQARHVPLLLPSEISSELVSVLQGQYQPDWIIGAHIQGVSFAGTQLFCSTFLNTFIKQQLSPDLALLLSTSGSTGSPKLVRLSYNNLQSNAESISQFLGLTPDERPLTVLPFYYSYGLSVINSHLQVGSCLVLGEVSVLTSQFYQVIRQHHVTSIAGVPYTYQMLRRTGFFKQDFSSLRNLTQAGGHLDDKIVGELSNLAVEKKWRFFVMYGQTEATARISYVPPDRLSEKIGSIGISIPRGRLQIDPESSELIYSGPNVMLGYANKREDLLLGDMQHGLLHTGDMARQDEDGYFYITGRIKRFIKLAGNRIGLDEVEQRLQSMLKLSVMLAGRDERLVIWIESENEDLLERSRHWLFSQFRIHHSLCRLKLVSSLPRLSSGKYDYSALSVDF